MNSIERTMAAIEFRRPDRIPVDLHNFQPAAAAMNVPMQVVFKDGELLAESQLKAWREFGHDVIILKCFVPLRRKERVKHIEYLNQMPLHQLKPLHHRSVE